MRKHTCSLLKKGLDIGEAGDGEVKPAEGSKTLFGLPKINRKHTLGCNYLPSIIYTQYVN
jgi:hypothetical protein